MGIGETEAWITSAVEDNMVNKAMTLASSLKRVRTARKLVVFTTTEVSEELRWKLSEVFDLVLLLEVAIPKGWTATNYAKIRGFSLRIFTKCVYLCPNALVLENCDEMFGKYATFAGPYSSDGNDIDTSVFCFSPNRTHEVALGKAALTAKKVEAFPQYFCAWIKDNVQKIEKLDCKYNTKINLRGISQGLVRKSSIFVFQDFHPLDFPEHMEINSTEVFGIVEKFLIEQCLNIYFQDVKQASVNSAGILSIHNKSEPIAIVGMSFRFPGGNNVEQFWSLLADGRNAVVPVPSNRWIKEHSYLPCKNRKIQAGFLNVPVDEFDAKFFGLSPKEAEFLDPQQRMLMEVTWEALEDAMIDPLKLIDTHTGIFIGSWIHDYKDMLSHSVDVDFFRTYMGNSIASTTARLSHFLQTTGPSIATESGCSSAIVAVDMACKSLRNGDSDVAIAGGVNLLLHCFDTSLLEYVFSPDFRCKTFDANANGFARGEACAILLLKRLSDAVKDEDNIWGLVRGTAIVQEGVSKSLGTPTAYCESLCMQLALKDAGVDPKDVSYIEAHGTGTSVGDPMEVLAINKTYSIGRTEPLFIGSVKTNVGHTEAVSGITGIIKVILSMKNELIPKHLNLETLNPQINLDIIPAQIPLKQVPWPRSNTKRRIAGVSSFGISGTDGHVIIEEPPQIVRHKFEFEQERPLHIMKLSTKSAESMDELIKQYLAICDEKVNRNEDNDREFASLAYSANSGRTSFKHRAVIIAKNFKDAAKRLKEKSFKQSEIQSKASKLCFLFPGQGSQYPSMAKELYETSPVFRDSYDLCHKILLRQYNISIKDTLWGNRGNNEEINQTLYSQISIFVVEYCLLNLWESWGVKPDYVIGHSLGEFAAAVAAGVLNIEDALMLVAERSRLIDSLPRGKMLAIKAGKEFVDEAIDEYQQNHPEFWADYAALNSLEQTVIAGDTNMICDFSEYCEEKSVKTIILAASHAFHSRHMDPMLDAYRKVVMRVKKQLYNSDQPKYISGMEGKLVDAKSVDAEYWVRHTRENVRYTDSCRTIQLEGCNLFLEVGPNTVLSALTRMNLEGHPITCLPSIRRKQDEWVTMLDSLANMYLSQWKGEIDWKGFDKFYPRSRVKIPFYPFIRRPIWTKIESRCAKLHPLIGTIMPTASNETVFQNSLTLKNVNFVQDHVIGNMVVFPAAGFLEMCLAGGHSAVQGFTDDLVMPRKPILLKSLKIPSPLAFCDSDVCKIQTVVSLDDVQDKNIVQEIGYSVKVHRHTAATDGVGKWIQHATSKFLPMIATLSGKFMDPIDISSIQSNWEKFDANEFYQRLPEIGLRFGPKFQSLEFGWKSGAGVLVSVKIPQDFKCYLIHPVVSDAMIQAVMMWTSKEKIKKKLQVPVQIGKFIWLKEAKSTTQYVFCCNGENSEVLCKLVDETGSPLAFMKDVDFIETTAKLVEGMISRQSTAMPMLWQDTWKSSRGPMQSYFTHESSLDDLAFTEDDLENLSRSNRMSENELKFYQNLITLTRCSVLKALYILGWEPEKMQKFSVDSLIENLNIKDNFRQYIQFFLLSLTKKDCGMLEALNMEGDTFQFWGDAPRREKLEESLRSIGNATDVTREEYKLIMEIEKSLPKILSGELNPLILLFPDDSSKASAAKFYASVMPHLHSEVIFEIKIGNHLRNAERAYTNKFKCSKFRPVYRILEIGAGTGVFTTRFLNQIIPKIKAAGEIEYHFTDITAAFFCLSEKNIKEHLKYVIFKKFDMEKDPLEQGLCPGYFDMIVAVEVFHIAKDIKKTLKSVRSLLKPGGLITALETVYPDERVTFVFGLLDAYWQFTDREFRKSHTTLTPKMWKEAMIESGFCGVSVTPMYKNIHGVIAAHASHDENSFLMDLNPPHHCWIIFGEDDDFSEGLCKNLSNVNRKCLVVPKQATEELTEMSLKKHFQNVIASAIEGTGRIEGLIYLWSLAPNIRDQTKVSLPFVTLMKLVSDLKSIPKTFAIMKGTCAIENSDTIDPTPGTLIGFCRALQNENSRLNPVYLDLDPNKTTMEQLDEVFMNLWVEHKQGAAFRDGVRLCPKLTTGKVARNEPLPLPCGCDRFQLVLPETRLISDLEFSYLEPYTIGEKEVEVQIKAMALNFRDVFAVLKPIPAFEKFNSVGLDYSGVVVKVGPQVTKVKVGERVIGLLLSDNLSLPSHYKSEENNVVSLPETMTFAEGVTLPAVFSTAVYCLFKVAKVKKGETVLIHTASGGVGLVAIQLCKYIDANIIATAGSERKRTYLRNLGITHVFSSRSTDFKNEILKRTGGRGVDIVLNSVTGPGFKEASLDVLSQNGRFIEMSKLNVWNNEEVRGLRPDVFYALVDLTSLEFHEYENLSEELRNFIETGLVKPIAYERFDSLNIRGALKYLQKAKHIGKIVCIMPEVKLQKSQLIVTTPLFNEDSTYLVTGGLGGIGFEVVKWMLQKGAKHIAVVSRSTPKPEVAGQFEAWNKAGKHVRPFLVDVGDYNQCKVLLHDLKKPELGFPQLRGVMHVAGVLQDALLENQSWSKFTETYNPKVNGSWNLHDLTKGYLLEHFVLFSSIAATFGSPGQTNHSASNAFEDCFSAYRRSNGLQSTCVNWGNWGEVGVATELDFPGIRPISTSEGLLALETFLTTQTSHMCVLNVDAFSLTLKLFPQVKHYLDDCRLLEDVKTSPLISTDEFWDKIDSATDRQGKVYCFKKFIKTVVRNILKMNADESIDDQTDFHTLGLDSLLMLEMKNGMQNTLGGRMTLTANQLKDCSNTEILANTLVDILEGEFDDDQGLLGHEEFKQLIRDDSNLLSETLSVENLKSKSIDQVETVLLTGATGNLGPYLLRYITQRTHIKKVYCLVRPSAKQTGMQKLEARLQQLNFAEDDVLSEVEVIEGDLASPMFGLQHEQYYKLCSDVDAVIHSAVKADHFAKYWKAPDTRKSHVRTVNVLGTVRLLEFAAERKLKHFFHASTLLAFAGMGRNGEFSEGWQSVAALDSFDGICKAGYFVTKHVAEQLVCQALIKGIPCKAFRFPHIAGDSKTGRLDYQQNHILLRWLASMKVGAMHDLPSPFSTFPVDHCARISLDIFFNPDAPFDVYNVVQKRMEVEQVLVEVAESFGIKMELVPHAEFVEKLKAEDEKSPIAPFSKFYVEGQSEFIANFENPSNLALKRYLEDSGNILSSSNLSRYAPDYDNCVEPMHQVLMRDFTYLKHAGVFAKYGIELGSSVQHL